MENLTLDDLFTGPILGTGEQENDDFDQKEIEAQREILREEYPITDPYDEDENKDRDFPGNS